MIPHTAMTGRGHDPSGRERGETRGGRQTDLDAPTMFNLRTLQRHRIVLETASPLWSRLRGMEDYESPEWHPAFEEYCETIYELEEDDLDVIQARIADRLEVSRPSVSEMVKRMEAEGLIDIGEKITLTAQGMHLAETVVRRHRLAERFLTDVLNLSWAQAHQEAGKWEHIISPTVEKAMMDLLDEPTTCPHGNPIPGSDYETPDLVTLNTIEVGENLTIRRITEELEFTEGMLDFLEESSIVPGSKGRLSAKSPDGTSTVIIDGTPVVVGGFASARILVSAPT